MTAFQPFLAFAKTSSNIAFLDTSMDYESGDLTVDYDLTDFSEIERISEPAIYRVLTSTPLQGDISDNSLKIDTQESKPSKTKVNSEKSSVKDVIEYLKTKQKVEYDEIDYTMLAHAKCIKKFSPKRQSLIKFKIAEMIMQQETLHFGEITSTSFKCKNQNLKSASNTVSTPTYEPEFIHIEYDDDYQTDILENYD